jgi:hypothetical protein
VSRLGDVLLPGEWTSRDGVDCFGVEEQLSFDEREGGRANGSARWMRRRALGCAGASRLATWVARRSVAGRRVSEALNSALRRRRAQRASARGPATILKTRRRAGGEGRGQCSCFRPRRRKRADSATHTHTDSDTDLDELERRAVVVGMELREDVYLAVAAGSCCSPRGRSRYRIDSVGRVYRGGQ